MMADDSGENSKNLKREVNSDEEVMDPAPPPKKRQYEVLTSKKKATEGEESNLDISSEKKREDAAVSQNSHLQIMEEAQGSCEGSLSKCVPSKVMQVAGDSASPSPLDVCKDWAASCGAELLVTPDGHTVDDEDMSDYLPNSDSKAEAMPPPPGVASLFPEMSEEVYAEMECELQKEIKVLKERYERIFESLDKLEDTLETKTE